MIDDEHPNDCDCDLCGRLPSDEAIYLLLSEPSDLFPSERPEVAALLVERWQRGGP